MSTSADPQLVNGILEKLRSLTPEELNRRVEELDKKVKSAPSYTINELIEWRILNPNEKLISLGHTQEIGILKEGSNLIVSLRKMAEAYTKGFYFEWFDHAIYQLEALLRLFLSKKKSDFKSKQTYTFGKTLLLAGKHGFDKSILSRLSEFNSSRIKAIHKFLVSKFTYEDLKGEIDKHQFEKLYGDVGKFLGSSVGKEF